MDSDRELVNRVRAALAAAGDPERAAGQQRYMRSVMPFHGLTSAELTRTVRSVYAEHRLTERARWEATVRALWDEAGHREERYAAIALAGHRHYRPWQDPDALELYRHLVVTGAWWDYVDDVATHRVAPILAAHRDAVTPVMASWARDDHMWLRRTAVLSQLNHKGDTDVALLEDVVRANLLDSRHGREFFVRKAVGWALREYAKTDPEWVRGLLATLDDRLSPLSRREATKHLAASGSGGS
ncbi:DNA alkylation repair protein [Georgenia halophila]|uniref:DNA alkylation repair protein n=1 Tax=Georgenia halophila TaxID=620889 RepID=A0ABP8LAY1_9MICO